MRKKLIFLIFPLFRYFSCLILLTAAYLNGSSQDITWTGNAGDNDWHKACNWDLNIVPTCSHDVKILGSALPEISGIAHCNSLEVSSGTGAQVQITGTARIDIASWGGTCSDPITINPSPVSSPATSITGTTTICSGGSTTLTRNGGSLGLGGSWQWYSGSCGGTSVGSGNSINVSPASTTTYFLRAEGACNTTSCVSATVTVQSQPTAPTTAPKSPNVTDVCTNTSVGLSGTASGGTNRGCTIEYRTSVNGGGSWSGASTTVPTGLSSATTGTNRIQVQARRVSCSTSGCNNTGWNTVAQWNVVAQPTAPSITKNPNTASVSGGNVSATFSGGNPGVSCTIVYEYRRRNTSNVWSAWTSYTPGSNISTTGYNRVEVRTRRESCQSGCSNSSYNTVSWDVAVPGSDFNACTNPCSIGSGGGFCSFAFFGWCSGGPIYHTFCNNTSYTITITLPDISSYGAAWDPTGPVVIPPGGFANIGVYQAGFCSGMAIFPMEWIDWSSADGSFGTITFTL